MPSLEYVSAAANRHPYAAHVSSASLVAFGSSNLIALWDTTDVHNRGVQETLAGHQGLVTCVRFASNSTLFSADDAGTLCLWKRNDSLQWKKDLSLKAHALSISALCSLEGYLITGSSDASLKVWNVDFANAGRLECVQTIDLKGSYPISLSLACLPQSKVLALAVGCTTKDVQLWTRSEESFIQSAILPGHEDWIRTVSFCHNTNKDGALILASGSQDATIRLWSIESYNKVNTSLASGNRKNVTPDDLIDTFEASLGDIGESEEGGKQISLKRHVIAVRGSTGVQQYSVTFDALLIGHEASVNSLSWQPHQSTDVLLTLLSTSTDSSVILWSPSEIIMSQQESTSIWISRQRFGDVGGQRLGGFVGCLWAANGGEVMAYGWSGGWRRWRCNDTAEDQWSEIGAVGGHHGHVKAIDWAPNGKYLISAGLDQTTRIHGPIPSKEHSAVTSWHELSRPQVHGYDLVGVVFISPLKFASVADEKVARVFEAPRGFVQTLQGLGVSTFSEEEHARPESAMVPPLGLSNKASDQINYSLSSTNSGECRRPFEGELAAATLWPETEKIFGHGYESVTIAVSNSKNLIATACKATTSEHAVIRIYNTKTWQTFGAPLVGHNLTITRIRFSPDDTLLLSVSRDRSWRLFKIRDDTGYVPLEADKSHSRIIWDCSWASEGDLFATASRDKTVRIWTEKERKWVNGLTIKCQEAATAVAFSSSLPNETRKLSIGLENGEILVYKDNNTAQMDWILESTIPVATAHTKQIHALAWSPDISQEPILASCSEDGTVKVYRFTSA